MATLFLWFSLALAGDSAISRPLPGGSRMMEADDALANLRSWRVGVADQFGAALFTGDPDRLECMEGKDPAMLALIQAAESARRDLGPAVLAGNHAKAARELGLIRVAVAQGESLHLASARCGTLQAAPVEPTPSPESWETSVDDDLADVARDPLDLTFPKY
jgi:hypothetical protein